MAHIIETIINGETCYLSSPFDTGVILSPKKEAEKTAKISLASVVEAYNIRGCLNRHNYNNLDNKENEYHSWEEAEATFKHYLEEGPLIHLSDDGDSWLIRESEILLIIDQTKRYYLPCIWAPKGSRVGFSYVKDTYYKIDTNGLKALASATSITLSYKSKKEEVFEKEVRIDGFQEVAEVFYKEYYLMNFGSPEEQKAIKSELKEKQDEIKKSLDNKRVRYVIKREKEKEREAEKAEQLAEEKAEWNEAGLMAKAKMLLKRFWIVVILILLFYFLLFF